MIVSSLRSNSVVTLYTISFLYFALVQLYVLILSFYLVVGVFTGGMLDFNFDDGLAAFIQSFFSSSGGGIVLIALVSTYGIYIIASILYLDPWHILTSSWAIFPRHDNKHQCAHGLRVLQLARCLLGHKRI